MSVYRPKRSPFYTSDFWIEGHRFHIATKATTKREAEAIERQERERAKGIVAQASAAKTSLRLDDIAGRYWTEHGQHLADAASLWARLGRVIEFFGKDKIITEISDDDVARLVAWRRGHRKQNLGSAEIAATGQTVCELHSGPAGGGALISAFTVNHTTATLRKLFTRAKLWGVRFAHEPKWTRHLLPVPVERVRELSDAEADQFDAVMRPDYAAFFAFARASGLRLRECLLRWSEVEANQIVKLGKGGRRVVVPITSELRLILESQRGHHPEFVFTYVCRRADKGTKGARYPITYGGVQAEWKLLRKRSGVVGFRLHDYRHDFGTKLLRATGNLKLVQKAMNHRNINTTMRYAHVLDSEVADAMERVAESRKKSRTRLKVVEKGR